MTSRTGLCLRFSLLTIAFSSDGKKVAVALPTESFFGFVRHKDKLLLSQSNTTRYLTAIRTNKRNLECVSHE
jgi:hypothetical protein